MFRIQSFPGCGQAVIRLDVVHRILLATIFLCYNSLRLLNSPQARKFCGDNVKS